MLTKNTDIITAISVVAMTSTSERRRKTSTQKSPFSFHTRTLSLFRENTKQRKQLLFYLFSTLLHQRKMCGGIAWRFPLPLVPLFVLLNENERSKVWKEQMKRLQSAIDPKKLRKLLNATKKELQRAAQLSLLGYSLCAWKSLRKAHLDPLSDCALQMLLMSRAGDFRGVLHIFRACLLQTNRFVPSATPFSPDLASCFVSFGCLNERCPKRGVPSSDVDFFKLLLSSSCAPCGGTSPDLWSLFSSFGDFSVLDQACDGVGISRVSQELRTFEAAAHALYEAALALEGHCRRQRQKANSAAANNTVRKTARDWLLLQRNVFAWAFKMSQDPYLQGLCLYSISALSLGATEREMTGAALMGDHIRRSIFGRAMEKFRGINEVNDPKSADAAKEMLQQCEAIYDEGKDDSSLFVPWSAPFALEQTVSAHRFASCFFSKPTFCDTCGEFIKSPFPPNGSECSGCHLKLHSGCAEMLLPCVKQVEFTPEQRMRNCYWQKNKGLMLVWKRVAPNVPKDVVMILSTMI